MKLFCVDAFERDGVCNPVPKVCRLLSCAKHYTNPRPQTLRTGCISRPAPSRPERDGVCNPVPKVCRLLSCAKHYTNPRPQTLRTGYISRPAPSRPERDGVCNPVPKVCRLPSCAKHYTNPRPQTLRTGCISRPAPSRFSALPFPATRFHAQETRHKYPAIPAPGLSKPASPYRPGAKHPSIYAACRRVWLCRNRFDL